jgi:DNA-binding transcriptional LysR family regulator
MVPRSHRLASRRSAAITELRQERIIVLTDRELSAALAAAFAAASAQPASETGMPGIDSLKRAVEMGLGVGLVPSSAAPSTGPLVVVPLASTSFLNAVTVVSRRHESLTGNVACFIDAVRRSQEPIVTFGEPADARRTAARI